MLATTGVANAAVTQYSNRTSFETAASSLTTETFNSYTTDAAFSSGSVDVGDFTLSHSGTYGGVKISSNGSGFMNVDGTAHVQGLGFTNDVITFVFDMAINYFGVDLFAVNDGIEREVVDLAGSTYTMPVFSSNVRSFVGFVSDTAFTTISFRAVAGESAGYDNVSYGVSPVPLPAGGMLLLTALGAFGIVRRRKTA